MTHSATLLSDAASAGRGLMMGASHHEGERTGAPLRNVTMSSQQSVSTGIISFVQKSYRLLRQLGQGACGKTVLLQDEQIDELFVCKKYVPFSEEERSTLFANFLREIKLLHKVHHANLVRIFNYYVYLEEKTAYILMEFVDGLDLEEFVKANPEQIDDLFVQTVAGFAHLERCGILHRDVSSRNILVDKTGVVKIIDFGFGKQINSPADFKKSVTLNWWCEPPSDFQEGRYDFATEVYFVGKLFESLVQDQDLSQFQYTLALREMCQYDSTKRLPTFVAVERTIQSGKLFEGGFSDDDMQVYREFADAVSRHVSKISTTATYAMDAEALRSRLSDLHRNCMLEQAVPDASTVVDCLVEGGFFFQKFGFPVHSLRNFVGLLKSCSPGKIDILMGNLRSRLDSVPRYSQDDLDDVPF
jgi:eukaryotic-like serine/threonine-protein kinase